MNWFTKLVIALVVLSLQVATSVADTPKITVEVAVVVRTPEKPFGVSLEDELKEAVKSTAAARPGGEALFKHWLPGQERKHLFIDLMSATTRLGDEVTFQARQTIGSHRDDVAPKGVFSSNPLGNGITFKVKGTETKDGRLQVGFTFEKSTLRKEDAWQEDPETKKMHRAPVTHSTGMTSVVSLEPNVPLVIALGSGSSYKQDGNVKTFERVLVVRAFLTDTVREDKLVEGNQ